MDHPSLYGRDGDLYDRSADKKARRGASGAEAGKEVNEVNAADVIMLVIVIACLGIAVRGAIRHFRGEGACCGGSRGNRHDKKCLTGPLVDTKVFSIAGMHCQNCAQKLEDALNAIDGVAAEVSFSAKTACVRCDRPIEEVRLYRAIQDAGYQVRSKVQ